MKRFSLCFLLLVFSSLPAQAQRSELSHGGFGGDQKTDAKAYTNIAGQWIMTLEMAMGTANPVLELKQDGEKITGTYTGRYGTNPLQGTIKQSAIVFSVAMTAEGMEVTLTFTGEVAADGLSMKGNASLSEMGEATWTAKKEKSL
jgi:hypothetical protein